MQNAAFDDIVLEYEVYGAGAPAVFIHGSFIADTFAPVVGQTGLAGFSLITYHRRGYVGSSRVDRPLSIAEQAADCRGLLSYLGVQRCHVVGHSFGGAVAIQLALDCPQIVHSLAVLEPALIIGATGQSYKESLEQSIRRYQELETGTVLDAFLEARWPGYANYLEKILAGAFAQALADAGTTFESELPGLLNWTFDEKAASRVAQPVLTLLGGASEALWARFGEVHRLLLEWLPNAEGYVLPDTTHFLQMEKPAEMAHALASFFTRHPVSN